MDEALLQIVVPTAGARLTPSYRPIKKLVKAAALRGTARSSAS